MIITQEVISRRTVLRGIGVTLALPLLDGMVPALTAVEKTAAKRRQSFWRGIRSERHDDEGLAAGCRRHGIRVHVLDEHPGALPRPGARPEQSELCSDGRPSRRHARQGFHALSHRRFAADERIHHRCRYFSGSNPRAGDGKHTQLASLELGIESSDMAGACDTGFACPYTNTISWRSANTPLPTANNPRVIFERLFGDSGSTDPKARLARLRQQRSILGFHDRGGLRLSDQALPG